MRPLIPVASPCVHDLHAWALVPLIRLERGNLFEDLCNLISKTACPVAKGALNSLHFISLEAMHAVMQVRE